MNLNMIRPKNKTEDLLLSLNKNCGTLLNQIHTRPEETLECKMFKSRKTFHFDTPTQVKEDWMVGLTDIEVYVSIFNINTTNNKFNL